MKRPKFFNVFTGLMIVAGFAFALRLVDVLTFNQSMTAVAEEAAVAPPSDVSKDQLKNAAAATQKPEETAATADSVKTDAAKPDAAKAEAPAGSDTNAQANPAPPEDDAHAYSAAELDVLQSLSKRRDDLDKRDKKIAEREALLTAAEQEVDHKIAELNKLKGEIEALLGKQQKMEEERLTSLVKIYENMKPKEAATIFNTLDLDVLLAVVGRMNERKTSPILAAMDPDKARVVTIKLAEQRKLPQAAPDSTDKKPAPAKP